MSNKDLAARNFENKIKEFQSNQRRSYWHQSWDNKKVFAYMLSLSESDIKKIISSKYWNNYPSWSTSTSKVIGPVIQHIVRTSSSEFPKLFNLIGKAGSGIWLANALDYSNGSERISIAKRGRKSKDGRVRLRAAKILPQRYLKAMLEDSRSDVRYQSIKRLANSGMDLSEYIKSDDSWISYVSLINTPIDKFDYKKLLKESAGILSSTPKKKGYAWMSSDWRTRRVVSHLLSKVPKDDLVYYLHLSDEYNDIASLINSRMSSKWG